MKSIVSCPIKTLTLARLNSPNHGDTDRPGGVTDTQAKVGVVGLLVRPHLGKVDDLCQETQYVWLEVLQGSIRNETTMVA